MIARKESLSKLSSFLTTKNTIHIITGLVVAGIFLSEGVIKEQTSRSNFSVQKNTQFSHPPRIPVFIGDSVDSKGIDPFQFQPRTEREHDAIHDNVQVRGQAVVIERGISEDQPKETAANSFERQVKALGLKLQTNTKDSSEDKGADFFKAARQKLPPSMNDTGVAVPISTVPVFLTTNDTVNTISKVQNVAQNISSSVNTANIALSTHATANNSSLLRNASTTISTSNHTARNISTVATPKVPARESKTPKKSTTKFRGVQRTAELESLFKVDNVTKLSFMLYRMIKTHQIKTILDVPCSRSTLWTPKLLEVLEFEVPRFQYRCLTPDDLTLAQGVLRFKDLESVIVLKDSTPWASKLPKVDLAFVWYGLGFLPPGDSWKLIKALHAANSKYVIVPNYPGVKNNPGSGSKTGRINVRRAPYRFNEPLRVVNNISLQAGVPKQLLLYTLNTIKSEVI